MSTTRNLPCQAPAGHHWVWRPTAEVETGHLWTVLEPGEPRNACHYGYRPAEPGKPGRRACGKWSVARLSFTVQSHQRMADFCEDHLFSRRIIDGVLHTEVLVPIPGGEAA